MAGMGGRSVRIGAAVVALGASSVGPPTVTAAPVFSPGKGPLAGPALSGDRVVWAEPAGRGFRVVISTADGGRRPLATLKPSVSAEEFRGFPALSGAPGSVGVESDEGSVCAKCDGSISARIFLLSGEGTSTRSLSEVVADVPFRAVDVSGDATVFRGPSCRELSVVELSPDGPVARFATPSLRSPRLAGSFLAGQAVPACESALPLRRDLVVVDWPTGKEVYRVPAAVLPGAVTSLDVQSDGKIVFSHYTGADIGDQRVSWASPAEPVPHDLGAPSRRAYEVKLANDTAVFAGGRVTVTDTAVRSLIPNGEIGTATLGGATGADRVPADLVLGSDSFDFDGTRLAWREMRCDGPVIRTATISDIPRSSRRKDCALTFRRPPTVGSRGIRIALSCLGLLAPCGAREFVIRTASRPGRVVGKVHLRGNVGKTIFTIPIAAAGRELIKRKGALSVRGEAVMTDSAGRRERRRQTFRLSD